MRLFVDISPHGLGHLAQMAPVLNALHDRQPGLALVIRSGLDLHQLQSRIGAPFLHLHESSDFGYVMHDAVRIDMAASAHAYQTAHEDWEGRVAAESRLLAGLNISHVLSDVSYLPLAGAARAGLPAAALCSLNWADLFLHFFGHETWATPIHEQMLAAYDSARGFLRCEPAMPMQNLGNTLAIAPVIPTLPQRRKPVGAWPTEGVRRILIAMGGITMRLPLEDWPRHPGVEWWVPEEWHCTHPDARSHNCRGAAFTTLLAGMDAIITKPGYGTFVEAAALGVPVLYQAREDWPEQQVLTDWLKQHARCAVVEPQVLAAGEVLAELETLWSLPPAPGFPVHGADQAADWLCENLFS